MIFGSGRRGTAALHQAEAEQLDASATAAAYYCERGHRAAQAIKYWADRRGFIAESSEQKDELAAGRPSHGDRCATWLEVRGAQCGGGAGAHDSGATSLVESIKIRNRRLLATGKARLRSDLVFCAGGFLIFFAGLPRVSPLRTIER